MATLQVLRKRYKSIQATADMASAMKTASSVKYAKISRILTGIDAYARACDDTLALFGDAVLLRKTDKVQTRNCMVLFSNDRGFCGAFNRELLAFFRTRMDEEAEPPLLLVSGQEGISFCKKNGLEFEELKFPDIPEYADAEALTQKLLGLYESGEVDRVFIVHQHFENMMKQTPDAEQILPHQPKEGAADAEDILFLPDREKAMEMPAKYCLTNSIYRIMLGHCAGIQAATTVAMRSACDNAEKSLEELGVEINRIRQAEVTNSVIETSSYLVNEEESMN